MFLIDLLAGCGEQQAQNNAVVAPAPATKAAPAPAPTAPAPAPLSAPMSATGYALNGTEPFWGGTVTGTDVRYMTPERQFGDVVETRLSFASDAETYSGSFRGRPFVLTLRRDRCSDGMSDRVYAFTATLQVLGETRRGCADPEEPRP